MTWAEWLAVISIAVGFLTAVGGIVGGRFEYWYAQRQDLKREKERNRNQEEMARIEADTRIRERAITRLYGFQSSDGFEFTPPDPQRRQDNSN